MSKLFLRGLFHAMGVAGYVFLVALLFANGSRLFGNGKQGFWMPFFMLMLLVFSVAAVGSLIFGKPILMYLENQKMEAVKLLVYTLVWLFLAIVATLAAKVLV